MDFKHYPVLLKEVVENVVTKKGVYVDATFGGGGYSQEMIKAGAEVIGIDLDDYALEHGKSLKLKKLKLVKGNFADIVDLIGVEKVDGIVADLGFSSYQLEESRRGFSFQSDEDLDMRLDPTGTVSAKQFLAKAKESKIAEVIREYGEENFAGRIARHIVESRPINTTSQLTEVIKKAVPKMQPMKLQDIYRRVFQAIRIEVNGELESLKKLLDKGVDVLRPGGRIGIVTFHSLEDRIVKKTFEKLAKECTCPKEFPVCMCGADPRLKIITKKPILPSEEELRQNTKSKSAKLRVAERI